jgi:hypothetical protein
MTTALHEHVVARIDAGHAAPSSSSTTAMYFDLGKIHFFESGPVGANLGLFESTPF